MSVWATVFILAAIWCIIHVLHHALSRQEGTLLPMQSYSSRTGSRLPAPFNLRHTNISLKGLHFQISTTRWNAHHDKLSSSLSRRENEKITTAVCAFYTLGAFVGALGMLAAVLAMVWGCIGAGWTLFQTMAYTDPVIKSSMNTLLKRSASISALEDAVPPRAGVLFPSITPIIPGVTVPLSHLPVIIAAVFISQAIHELGHALAATLEFLPMTSCGASFTVCIPAAFVSFPTTGMKTLPPKAHLRIIAGGPFHNIVFWSCLLLATQLGIANVISLVSGYQNVSSIGKVVVQVNSASPLSLHLQPGHIITKLDDTSLASSDSSLDTWSEYLQGRGKDTSLGWCVLKSVLAKSDECCTKSSTFSCFQTHDQLDRGCIDPVPVLTSTSKQGRCRTTDGCPSESLCVIPRNDSQLIRLMVRPSVSKVDEETIVLWSGPPIEIWEEVQVGTWIPRVWILPIWLPSLVATFWEYLTMATLSLYFFNLLPLPHLDGNELLSSLLDCVVFVDQGAVSYDFTALEAGNGRLEGPRTHRWKTRIMRYTPYTMTGIATSFVILSVSNAVY